ncbi:MAG: DUF5683 domain-containing protein [Candidatus Kapabacteria bacterium]|nr:DUF5683 domain-containing protein [Candidatus Kapabacteria bacterium]
MLEYRTNKNTDMSEFLKFFTELPAYLQIHFQDTISRYKKLIRMTAVALVLFVFFNSNTMLLKAESDSSKTEVNKSYKMSKSPSGAIWRSLVLPGWGQYYVESYWKAPVFTVAAGTLIYLLIDNHSKYVDYADKLDGMQLDDPNYRMTKVYREYYRDNRDMSGFYLLAVYIISAVDAYVGAHLYDFQIDDNLSLSLSSTPIPIPSVRFQIRF